MNCHPSGEHPLQGADHRIHFPPAQRAGLGDSCAACHTDRNVTMHVTASFQSIPGHPRWGVAPLSMAWQGKSIGEICRQLKDTARNGGRDLALLQEHIAKDDLVAWGWTPGPGREPAPGSQDIAGQADKSVDRQRRGMPVNPYLQGFASLISSDVISPVRTKSP